MDKLPTHAGSSPSARLPMLDAWRFIAAAAIVWLHTWMTFGGNVAEAGRFSVPFFAAVSSYLLFESLRRNSRASFIEFAMKRGRRIYLPFLGWCVIYFISSSLKRHFVTHRIHFPVNWSIFLAGTSLQLWFLPFVLIANLMLFPICEYLGPRRNSMGKWGASTIALFFGFAGSLFVFVPYPFSGDAGLDTSSQGVFYFLALSWQALPGLFWGLALAIFDPPAGKSRDRVAALGAVVLLTTMVLILLRGRSPLCESLSGIGALTVAILPWNSAMIRRLALWGTAAYGIYLAHVLFIEAMFAIVAKLHVRESVPHKLAEFLIALLLSAATVWLLNRSKWTSWLNG